MIAIKNKFAGNCTKCAKRVEAEAGVAIKETKTSPWQVFCFEDMPETHGAINPWKGQHRNRSAAAYGRSAWEARAIDNEYQDTDYYAHRCDCGNIRWWKATVGAAICPECGSMKDNSGNTYETQAHVYLHTL